MDRRAGLSERFYGSLLRLYPAAFRDRYAFEMVQLFGDQLRDARGQGAPFGVGAVWFRGLGDLVVTAVTERASGDRGPGRSLGEPPSGWTRLLGLVGIIGGAFLLAVFVVDIAPELNFVRLVVFNLGAITVALAVHRRQSKAGRRLSLVGTTPVILANAWYLVMLVLSIGRPEYPEPDAEFRPIFFYAAIALWLADAFFGLVAARLGAASRWAALALALGSLLALIGVGGLGFVDGPFADLVRPLSLLGLALVGLGWVLLGIDVATQPRASEIPDEGVG
jgi:hypothetical protein